MSSTGVGDATLGFIGLGAMGGAMCRRLMGAGYSVVGFDIDPERMAAAEATGVALAGSTPEVVAGQGVVLTSLRSSEVWVEVAEGELIPNARESQLFIDLGTVAAPETRRLAPRFRERGAWLVDAPVSGGPHGSETGTLRIFVGGDDEAVKRARPILEVLGEEGRVVHCGPSGAGQVVKGCNQLAMGIADAAYMEALAFGVREGIDPRDIAQAVGGGGGWRGHFGALAERIADGHSDSCYIKYPEFPYFLAEGHEQGTPMPITRALHEFGSKVESTYRDNMGRPTISFWNELMTRDPEE